MRKFHGSGWKFELPVISKHSVLFIKQEAKNEGISQKNTREPTPEKMMLQAPSWHVLIHKKALFVLQAVPDKFHKIRVG